MRSSKFSEEQVARVVRESNASKWFGTMTAKPFTIVLPSTAHHDERD